MRLGTTPDSTLLPHISGVAGAIAVAQDAAIGGADEAPASGPGGAERARIQPIDTRIRLHFKEKHVSSCNTIRNTI